MDIRALPSARVEGGTRLIQKTPPRRPVLAIHGTRDEIVPYPQGQLLAKLLPECTFVSLPGAGHNDTFNGDFFRKVMNAMDAFIGRD